MQTKSTFKPSVVRLQRKGPRDTKTVPNQSLSIKTIMERFTRGIPVDTIRRNGIYVDQDEHDLEKLANASFDEKASMAEHLKDRNDLIKASFDEAKAQAQNEAQAAARKKEARTGIAPDDDEGGGQEDGERATQRLASKKGRAENK